MERKYLKYLMRKVGILLLFLVMFSFCTYGFDLGNYTGPIVFEYLGYNVRRQYKYDSKQNLWIPEEKARSGLAKSKQESLSEGEYSPDGVADRWGIIYVTAIYTGEGSNLNQIWSPLLEGEEITGVMWGFDDALIKSEGGGITLLQEGGYIALYLDDSPEYFPLNMPSTVSEDLKVGERLDPDPWGATDGTLFLFLKAAEGISKEYPSATREVFFKSSEDFPFQGNGIAFFDVIGGAYAKMFDNNFRWEVDINDDGNLDFYKEAVDGVVIDVYKAIEEEFFNNQGMGYIIGYVIPEPGSLSLSLLGVGLILILKNKRKSPCRKN